MMSWLTSPREHQDIVPYIPLYHDPVCARGDNGGVAQFLGNSSGIYAKAVVEGLQLLGTDELLEALLAGLGVFPNGEAPIDWETRRKRIYGLSDSESQD